MRVHSSLAARCIWHAQNVCCTTKSPPGSSVLTRWKHAASLCIGRSSQQQRNSWNSTKPQNGADVNTKRSITNDSTGHQDLEGYLAFAQRESLDTTTTVYKGTVFEYSVAKALKPFGMVLERVGKANDLGIDLLGQWLLPELTTVPVLLQCKISKALPQVIRELEGTCSSAPAKWSGSRRLALLASQHQASPGVIQALQKSPLCLGFVQVDSNGVVKQFLWNANAAEQSLSGLGITTKHVGSALKRSSEGKYTIDQSSVALTWKGKPWRVKND